MIKEIDSTTLLALVEAIRRSLRRGEMLNDQERARNEGVRDGMIRVLHIILDRKLVDEIYRIAERA